MEKMHAFAVFIEKYLRSYGGSDTNLTEAVKCTNSKTGMQREIVEIKII